MTRWKKWFAWYPVWVDRTSVPPWQSELVWFEFVEYDGYSYRRVSDD